MKNVILNSSSELPKFQRGASLRLRAMSLLVCMTFVLAACGGGGSSVQETVLPDPVPEAPQGDLLIAITDAEGDFVSYTVDVVSLTLEKANGDVVETLPLTTRIDFTELTEVTEFLTLATVPAGNYESVSLSLDYSNAEVIVQNEAGDAVMAATVDADGNVLGQFDLRVMLNDADVIRIAPGAPAAFSLDFDLDASNEIDLTAAVPIVTVEPFLLAQSELETDRAHRVRGVLQDVSSEASEFGLDVRPFRHRAGAFGQVTVTTDDLTQFEVDGVGYTGTAGLDAMQDLPANAPVIANGAINAGQLSADVVIAGSSVPWTDGTVIKGVVAARDGDTLTVRGAKIEYADGIELFRGEATVILGSLTTVTSPGVDNDTLGPDSVSVGQRLVAFGEVIDDRSVDASEGRVVLQTSQLTASVITPLPLIVDVHWLNARSPELFDFSGTGVDSDMNSDPAEYAVDTGALSLNSLDTGDLVRVRGLVAPFGQAPDDFTARTVINVDTESRPGTLNVVWVEGSSMPFHSLLPEQIDIDLSASREILRLRGVPRLLTNPLQSAVLYPPVSGEGLYAVKVRGSGELHVYRAFSELVAELDAQLDAGATLYRVSAQVRDSVDADGWETPRASFVFEAPSAP